MLVKIKSNLKLINQSINPKNNKKKNLVSFNTLDLLLNKNKLKLECKLNNKMKLIKKPKK